VKLSAAMLHRTRPYAVVTADADPYAENPSSRE
jgi:hypothetical protein